MGQRTEIALTGEQREVLERWARRPKTSQALAFRCRVVLAAAEGGSSIEIAEALGCNASTVGKWRGGVAGGGGGGVPHQPPAGGARPVTEEEGGGGGGEGAAHEAAAGAHLAAAQ